MSLLLNDIQLPLLVKAAIVDHNTLSWNNLDQLSSLWTGKTRDNNAVDL